MKKRVNWLLIPAVAMGLGACDKQDKTVKAPDAPAAADASVKDATVPPPAVVTPPKGVDERAAKLGFARYLPQDTEAVVSFYNGSKNAERVKNSKLWKLVQEQMGGGFGGAELQVVPEEPEMKDDAIEEDSEESGVEQADNITPDSVQGEVPPPADVTLLADQEPAGPAALFGTEFTLAMGKKTGEQFGNLLTVSSRMNYFNMRNLARTLLKTVKTGGMGDLEQSLGAGPNEQTFKDLLNDPKSGIGLIEKLSMPPLYLAFRTTEAERPGAAMEVASALENVGMLGPVVEPLKFEISGHAFEGSKIVGAKVSAEMSKNREAMEAEMDPALVGKLLEAVAKKDLIVASGLVGDYVVMVIGGSTDDFKIAETPADSLVSTQALAFTDGFSSKEFAAVSYGQKEMLETLVNSVGGVADMANGLRDGLAGAEGIGDTRDLEALFQIVAEREAALRKLAGVEATGMVAFFEEGLKIESFGGVDSGAVNWKATNVLSHLGDSSDVLMFADMTGDTTYSAKSKAYLEALMETGYAMAMKISNLPSEDGAISQFKDMAQTFDGKFRPDFVALWDAFSNDFGGSLGNESALVVDLKGGAPAVPGIPQTVVDQAKVPRISLIVPVTDRAKLSGSWDKMNGIATGALAKISQMTGQDIPMQKPLSSEKDGNVTWFFPMPFFTDDFLPSVTVGDKWFVASTSKMQALDLINQANAGGEGHQGVEFRMNFNTLRKYAGETLDMVDAHSEELMGSKMSPGDKKKAMDVISLLDDMDMLTVHARQEGGVQRSSIHFKTR